MRVPAAAATGRVGGQGHVAAEEAEDARDEVLLLEPRGEGRLRRRGRRPRRPLGAEAAEEAAEGGEGVGAEVGAEGLVPHDEVAVLGQRRPRRRVRGARLWESFIHVCIHFTLKVRQASDAMPLSSEY